MNRVLFMSIALCCHILVGMDDGDERRGIRPRDEIGQTKPGGSPSKAARHVIEESPTRPLRTQLSGIHVESKLPLRRKLPLGAQSAGGMSSKLPEVEASPVDSAAAAVSSGNLDELSPFSVAPRSPDVSETPLVDSASDAASSGCLDELGYPVSSKTPASMLAGCCSTPKSPAMPRHPMQLEPRAHKSGSPFDKARVSPIFEGYPHDTMGCREDADDGFLAKPRNAVICRRSEEAVRWLKEVETFVKQNRRDVWYPQMRGFLDELTASRLSRAEESAVPSTDDADDLFEPREGGASSEGLKCRSLHNSMFYSPQRSLPTIAQLVRILTRRGISLEGFPVPLIDFDHIMRKDGNTGYHVESEDDPVERIVLGSRENGRVYAGLWKNRKQMKYSTFFPYGSTDHDVARMVGHAFTHQIVRSQDENGSYRMIGFTGELDGHLFIEMFVSNSIEVIAFPLYQLLNLDDATIPDADVWVARCVDALNHSVPREGRSEVLGVLKTFLADETYYFIDVAPHVVSELGQASPELARGIMVKIAKPTLLGCQKLSDEARKCLSECEKRIMYRPVSMAGPAPRI